MKNPWLEIPLADYEGHMALPEVAQAELLADIFERMLRERAPASVAILGCAGGNGLDRIDPAVIKRISGIDINPDYIAAARERFQRQLPGLELITADLQTDDLQVEPVDLVFAALLFEYVDVGAVLPTIRRLLKPGGWLTTVLQLPHAEVPNVTPSPFLSMQSLAFCLRLVSPEGLREQAAAHGLVEVASERVASLGGKTFQVQTFVVQPSEHLDSEFESASLTLREGTTSDFAQLAEWNQQLIRDEGHRNRMTVPELAERMRCWLEQDYRATVFELAGTPVAYALFREQPDEIYLRQLFVVRERRRQGIGKQAIELLRTKVWPTNKRLTVEVLTANTAAVAFWRSVGYADYSLTLEILPPE